MHFSSAFLLAMSNCQRSFLPTIPSHVILKRAESFYQKRKGRQAGRISLIKGNSQKNK